MDKDGVIAEHLMVLDVKNTSCEIVERGFERSRCTEGKEEKYC